MRKDSTWAITTYFDPLASGNRLKTYHEFRRNLSVPLVTVELSFRDTFDLEPDDADIMIQLRGGAVLWQKERLLNIALNALPRHCDTVAWLDCDLVFTRDDWADAAGRLLDNFALVQPFHKFHYLGELDPARLPDRQSPNDYDAFAARYVQGTVPEECFVALGSSRHHHYMSGAAWVARRQTLDTHGYYDTGVIGSGDSLLVSAACSRHRDKAAALHMSERQRAHYGAWASRFYEDVRGRISFVEGDLLHLWHGDLAGRRYKERYEGFQRFDFDPERDLALAPNGVWRWNSDKPELHDFVKRHFELLDQSYKNRPCHPVSLCAVGD